jgi:hypothetical protein
VDGFALARLDLTRQDPLAGTTADISQEKVSWRGARGRRVARPLAKTAWVIVSLIHLADHRSRQDLHYSGRITQREGDYTRSLANGSQRGASVHRNIIVYMIPEVICLVAGRLVSE